MGEHAMPYKTRLESACEKIEAAQEDVAKATMAYRRGGSCDAVNRANKQLAQAHCQYREVSGGNVPDDRY